MEQSDKAGVSHGMDRDKHGTSGWDLWNRARNKGMVIGMDMIRIE